jgi:hypothetical protein
MTSPLKSSFSFLSKAKLSVSTEGSGMQLIT